MTAYAAPVLRALIQQTLQPINLYTRDVEELLMATCAQESLLGYYRTQAPTGPARGIFQVEGPTFNDVFTNYLAYHPPLLATVSAAFTNQPPNVDELVTNDPAAIIMCRVQYLRAPEPIPAATDIQGIWTLYKKRYNTPQGAAIQSEFMRHYNMLVAGK